LAGWVWFSVSVCGLPRGILAGRNSVQVPAPLFAAVLADPGDQVVASLVVIEQVQQLLAFREAVLARDGEVLVKRVPDGPREVGCLSAVTAGAISPWTAYERT
jgi:hypothetical protein